MIKGLKADYLIFDEYEHMKDDIIDTYIRKRNEYYKNPKRFKRPSTDQDYATLVDLWGSLSKPEQEEARRRLHATQEMDYSNLIARNNKRLLVLLG